MLAFKKDEDYHMLTEGKMYILLASWSILLVFITSVWGGQPDFSPSFKGEEVTIRGEVVEINHPILVLQGEDGKKYLVRLGPYWFWKQKGYQLEPGTTIEVIGFKRGKFIFPRLIKDHQVLRLRDERGFPLWRPH